MIQTIGLKRWYILSVYPSFEAYVKMKIERGINELGLKDKISQILIPSRNLDKVVRGKKKIINQKLYSGYVLLQMDLNDDTLALIESIPKSLSLLGSQGVPTALSEEELNVILDTIKGKVVEMKSASIFNKLDRVRITEGSFSNFCGVVESADSSRLKAKVTVSVFNRQTPVECDFDHLEKI